MKPETFQVALRRRLRLRLPLGCLQIQGVQIQCFCVVAGFSTPLSLIQGVQIQGFCVCVRRTFHALVLNTRFRQ